MEEKLINEDIKNILRSYSIGEIMKIEPMNKGSISNAIYILSNKGKWILRKLKNRNQGITDQNIKKTFIHGDLSKRNLIYSSEKVYIIDFGEFRQGDNHLDIAATLTSMINFKEGKEYVHKCLCVFHESYTNYMKDFQWDNLQKNIKLWIIRGILLYTSDTSSFVEKSKKVIDLESNLSRVILDNFI